MSGPSTVTCPCCGSAEYIVANVYGEGGRYCVLGDGGCGCSWDQSRRAPAAGDALERANEERVRLHNELLAARRDAERMEDALHQIKQWSLAYPLSVFPEPDFKRVAEVLKAAGITLDAVSASNMRHVITRVQAIVDAALRAEGE